MEIVTGHWAFCTCDDRLDHDDAQYKIILSAKNHFWLCPKCFDELKQVITETP